MKNRIWLFSMIFTGISLLINAQKTTLIDTSFTLINHNGEYILPFQVPANTSKLSFEVKGEIENGSFHASFTDPAGNRSDGFSLVTMESDDGYSYTIENSSQRRGVTSSNSSSNSNSNSNSNKNSQTSADAKSDKKAGVSSGARATNSSSKSADAKAGSKAGVSQGIGQSGSNSSVSVGKWSGAKGSMNDSFSNPEPGKWKITLHSQNVTGQYKILVYINR